MVRCASSCETRQDIHDILANPRKTYLFQTNSRIDKHSGVENQNNLFHFMELTLCGHRANYLSGRPNKFTATAPTNEGLSYILLTESMP